MTPAATLLTLILAKGGALLPFADEVLELKVEGTPATEVRALVRQVRISGAGAQASGWKTHGVCPRAHAEGADLVLDCTSAHLHARSAAGKVSIYKLRGLPWAAKDEPLPRFLFAPEQVGLGGACPGTTAAGKAECALSEGRALDAREQLRLALETEHRDYAAVRMADLALENDAPLEALEWLGKAGSGGEWGRLATIRVCELSGRCPTGSARDVLFDPSGLSAPLRRELKLRELRMLRFESPAAAVAKLFDAGSGSWPDALCAGTNICDNVLHEALATDDLEGRVTALSLFSSGPVSVAGSKRPWLAQAAADAAAALGAPHYAASALAAATPDVPRTQLPAHLRRVVQLYLQANEPGRASAVFAYAIDTLGPQVKNEVAWKKLRAPVPTAETPVAIFPTAGIELANELATATLARSHARQTR